LLSSAIYEIALILGGHRKDNKFWEHTLTSVARDLGVVDASVVCVDSSRQWRHWTDVWHNAAFRSLFQSGVRIVTAPFRRLRAKPHE